MTVDQPSVATDREAWLAERRFYCGASEVAAIFDCHPYLTQRKLQLLKRGEIDADEGTEATERGNELENFIAGCYRRKTGRQIEKWQGTVVHPDIPYFACNPDFKVVDEPRLVQCKSHLIFLAKEYGEEGSDEIPDHEIIQTQAEMHLTGYQWNDVPVCFNLHDVRIFPVEYKPEFGSIIQEKLVEWWTRHIIGDEMAPLTYADVDMVKAQYPNAREGASVIATDDVNDALVKLKECRDRKKKAEEEGKLYEAQIFDFAKDAEYIAWSGGKDVTAKTISGGWVERFYRKDYRAIKFPRS